LAKKVSKNVERPMDDINELNHSFQRAHCTPKSMKDTTAIDGGGKQAKVGGFGNAEISMGKEFKAGRDQTPVTCGVQIQQAELIK
jgi:hypothetical protein